MASRCFLLSITFLFSLYFTVLSIPGNPGKKEYKTYSDILTEKAACINSCEGFFDYIPEKNINSFEHIFKRKVFRTAGNPLKAVSYRKSKILPALSLSSLSSFILYFNLTIPISLRKLLI